MNQKHIRAVKMLQDKFAELNSERLPKRSDFSSDDACFIKQKLGPWPRALEEAGLKEKKRPDSRERNREKRREAALKKKEEKRKEKNNDETC